MADLLRFSLRRVFSILAVAVMMLTAGESYTPNTAVAQTTKKNTAKKASRSAGQNSKGKNTASSKSSKSKQSKATPAKKGGTSARRAVKATSPKSSAEAKRMQEAAQREIQQTKERLKLNEQEIKTGLSDLNRLSSEIATGRTQVQALQKKVSSLSQEISTLGAEIDRNEENLRVMREEYLKAVRKMRLTRKNQSTLAFIFASDNFNQAMRRIRYMRQFSAWKERKSADIDSTVKRLSSERDRLAGMKEAQSAALATLSKTQTELEGKHKAQESLVAGLRRNGEALQSHLAAKQNEANQLRSTIANLIAQEQAKAEAERKAREKAEVERIAREKAEAERKAAEEKAAAEAAAREQQLAANNDKKGSGRKTEKKKENKKKEDKKKNSEKSSRSKKDRKNRNKGDSPKTSGQAPAEVKTPAVEKTESRPAIEGSEFAKMRGSLPRPVDGAWRITNQFGRHSMPELPEVVYDNPGIDAEVNTGASVKAVCGGKVSGVYKVAGYGTVVIVSHGEYYTVYGNLSSASVAAGSTVKAGQQLGVAGADPDDPRRGSLHFEVWKGREKQNPSAWLR